MSVALGVVVGVSLLLLMKRASRSMTPEDPVLGMARVLGVVLIEMIAAVGVLTVLFFFAREALAAFGASMVAAFLVLAFIELVRFSGLTAALGRRR